MRFMTKLRISSLLAGATLAGLSAPAGAVPACPQTGAHLAGQACCSIPSLGTAAYACGSLRTSTAGGSGTARTMSACLMVGANPGSTRRAVSTCFLAGSRRGGSVEDNSLTTPQPRQCTTPPVVPTCNGASSFEINGFL